MEILFCHTPVTMNGNEPTTTKGKFYEVLRRLDDGSYVIKNDWGHHHCFSVHTVDKWFDVAGRPSYDRMKLLLGWLYESACQGERIEPHIEEEIRNALTLDSKGDPFKQ